MTARARQNGASSAVSPSLAKPATAYSAQQALTKSRHGASGDPSADALGASVSPAWKCQRPPTRLSANAALLALTSPRKTTTGQK